MAASSLGRVLAAATALLLPIVRSQVVQDDWLAPALPDYDTTLKVGDTFTIKWTKNLQGWFEQYAPTADVTNVDLWVLATESDDEISIQDGVNVNDTQSIDWKVDISDDQLTNSAFWSFQFRPSGATGSSEGEITSPVVVVRGTTDSSTTTTTADDDSETQTAGSTGTATSDATATGTADPDATGTDSPAGSSFAGATESDSSSGLSGGAIAGIVIGAIAILLGGAAIFLWWKKHNRRPGNTPGVYPADATGPVPPSGTPYKDATSPYMAQSDMSQSPAYLPPQELPANPNHHYELGPGR